ncbi:jacalin-related lectin 3-like [Aristolochia californica]|uniref:jacalin-related lectin 3-like n=1 Tax=Aristolochia californica TaxID=171875 RepID=UPI0035E02CAB
MARDRAYDFSNLHLQDMFLKDFNGNDKKKVVTVGPWGGGGGSPFDDGLYTTIRQLVVSHGAAIDSLLIEYHDKKGASVWSERHGGTGGTRTDKVMLDYPDEILLSINGFYGSITSRGPFMVRSLTFESNKRKYGPFGFQQGLHFSLPVTGGMIVGFHGRCGWYLDSVGVHIKPLNKPSPIVPSGAMNKIGYNIVRGSAGNGNDIVVAVREKEDSKIRPRGSSRQSSSSSSDSEGLSDSLLVVQKPTEANYPTNSTPGGPVKYGPWGGSGGSVFDDGAYTGVRQITLTRNAGITSIKVVYDKSGIALGSWKHGGAGGIKTDKIMFDYPYEILTHITGYYGTTLFMGPTAVKSLTFHTTKRKYGPYGEEQGTFFSSSKCEGMIVGFHGRKGWYIDSIGVHVLEGKLTLPQPPPPAPVSWADATLAEISHGVVKEPIPSGPGPWGGAGGRPWDDGVYNGVRQIFLTRSREGITSIQIEYDKIGQIIKSAMYGSGTGEATHRIRFEYPNEILNCICGYYGSVDRVETHKVIKSLTFHTSRGKYGPYGEEVGTFFTSTTTQGKVVGFHGRCSLYLDAIGVHMQHWLGEGKPAMKKISLFFG